MLMRVDRSALLVIDIQERLLPTMSDPTSVVENGAKLITAAGLLGVPKLISEQYPKGLGPTVPAITNVLGDAEVRNKISFSCGRDQGWSEAFTALDRSQAIVIGIEAHVCVMQTVADLLDSGVAVFLVADAVSSRRPENHRLACERMARAGAQVVSTEMVLFEWLREAGTPVFKDIQKLLK
ncbi:hydrolase [Magnetospira sp. QH-2]|uniref:hydrolase n=1 Tax=Magnetospira sp. (strain QH-2) TaxID=1288970 RepID=UPI0003E81779|nr:hydrolase [Magnetospira sp. QH-2]CCQ74395.1 Putative isochorismatase [Magnetospira sp. QH-2]